MTRKLITFHFDQLGEPRESRPPADRVIEGETWEFCYILSGVAEITEDGHAPVTYRAGDCFIMKPGYLGTWRTLETVRKVWVAA